MSVTFNPNDVYIIQRNETSSSFVERVLSSTPNTLLFFDSASRIVTLSTSSVGGIPPTASYAYTASVALNVPVTASYATFAETTNTASYAYTASVALNVPATASYATIAETASYIGAGASAASASYSNQSDTASYLKQGANIYLSQSYIYSDISASVPPSAIEGQMWWDADKHTYTIDTDKSRLQIGQENYIRAEAGEYIPDGAAVFLSDSNPNGLPIAYLALADGTELSSSVVGLSTQALNVGENGFITTTGIVNNLDTQTPDFNDGDTLYLSDTTSGSLRNTMPEHPAELVVVGTCLYRHPTVGRILVNVSQNIQDFVFVGPTSVPTFSNTGSISGSIVNVSTCEVHLCTTADGLGRIQHYSVPSASFTVTTPFLDVQYLIVEYNGGSPIYNVTTDLSTVDEVQTVPIATFTIGTSGALSYIDWDTAGTLLANKLNKRIIDMYGAQRASGLDIAASGSHITLTSGTGYMGIKQLTFTTASTEISNQFVLLGHSASIWSGSFLNGWVNNRYDNGTDLVPLDNNKYVINYVFRGIGSQNRCQVILSNQYDTYGDAVEGIVPELPAELENIAILCGRIITKESTATAQLVESAFTTIFSVAGITQHNNLNGLQGGTGNQYYHLTTAEYGNTSSGSFVRQIGLVSNATSASYIVPGATFYQVSGSNGMSASYIEPYDYSVDNVYRPPSKEGRTFWDHKWANWKVWQDTNYSSSTAAALNINLGRETCIPVHNPSNVTLTRLTPVYLSGSQTSSIYPFNQTWPDTYKPDVYAAEADGTNEKSDVVGLVRNTIPPYHDGYIITNGIMHNADVSALGSIGTKLWLAATGQALAYGITNVRPEQPYEAVSLGWVSEVGTGGGTQGSVVVDISPEAPPLNAYAGITSDIIITSNGSGSVYVSTGSVNLFDDATGFGLAYGHSLATQTMSLITGSTNYIVAEHSSSTEIAHYYLTTDSNYANGISIVRVAQLDIYNETTSSWDVHKFDVGIVGLALANKLNNKDISLYGYQRESGLTLYTTGSTGGFGITEGTIWYGPNSHIVELFDTTIPGYYTYIFHTTQSNGTASWHQHTSSIYHTGLYDSSSGVGLGEMGLDVCAPDSWSVNFVYRIIGTTDEAAIVLSNAQYATELEASNNATTPPNLPSTIRDQCILVGRFIVQSGSYATTVIESAFTNQFIAAVVTDHESLTGLQGGQGGEHKHLTADEYTGTGTGVFMRNSNPVFAGATPAHVPYWKNGGTLTLTGSVQVYGDQYVLINSGSPNPTFPEALLVQQKNTSSALTIGGYSNVDNFSQIYNQNFSSGSEASTDICATADIGTQDANFIDMGIASSQFASVFWPWIQPLDGYLETHGGNLWLGTLTTHSLKFVFNNTASTNYADATGFYLSGSWFGTSSWAGNAISASWAPDQTTTVASASWASASLTSSHLNDGQYSVTGITASLHGTASWAVSASWAPDVTLTVESASWASASLSSSYLNDGQYSVTGISASLHGTASWAVSASWAPDQTVTVTSASWASSSISSSHAVTASFANQSFSASYSDTASFALGIPIMKSGIAAGASFAGNPKTASIVFTKPFPNNNYSVVVTGESSRTWTIQSKVSGSFVINANNNTAFATNTFWQAVQTGEYYS